MTEAKVIERVGKLLRLAAPSSNTTLAERTAAALEAAKLIDEHKIAITGAQSPGKSGGGINKVSKDTWVLTQSLDHHGCTCCGGMISRGDVVWFRSVNGERQFRHNAGRCSVG